MKSVSGKALAKALERHGWELLRVRGSHHIYGKPGMRERISIPMHPTQSLKQGLLSHLMKIAGLTEADL
ncbi:MAG: addiction module toxin, HicA family [Candidatus Hydrogenedens sp.]|nr:addiction module toxin, HicA family [Candidatus Hydrogenedens sp.]